jgi:D-alanine transaminase
MSTQKTIAYFNSQEIPLDQLLIPINDRAFLFGDAVYEVLRVYQGKPFLLNQHMDRLSNSLEAISIPVIEDIKEKILLNIKANGIDDGMVYLQISRGQALRTHSFHDLVLKPNVLIYALSLPISCSKKQPGLFAITHEDLRWGRCDIKSVNLLPNCLAQTKAHGLGCKEAILIRDNLITEGTSSNVFLVKNNIISTPALSQNILPGTRRQFVINALKKLDYQIEERMIDKNELFESTEVFITSTLKEAIAVVKIDNHNIGDGQVGHIASLARTQILESAFA